MSHSTNTLCPPKHMWQRAIASADDDVKAVLDLAKTGKRDVLQAVRKVADEKREQAIWRFWRCEPLQQETVIVRDLLEKIVRWVDVLRGSDLHIPEESQAAWRLLWSPFWFLLRRPVEDVQAFGRLVYDLEYAARLIVEYEILDMEKSGPFISAESSPENALVFLYDGLLRLLTYRIRTAAHESGQHPDAQEAALPLREALSTKESQVHLCIGLGFNMNLTPTGEMYARGCESASVQKISVSQDLQHDVRNWITGNPEDDHHVRSKIVPANADFLGLASFGSWWGASSSSLLVMHDLRDGTKGICDTISETISHATANLEHTAPLFHVDCTGKSSGQEILKRIVAELAFGGTEGRLETWDSVIAEYHVQQTQAEMKGGTVLPMSIPDCITAILDIAAAGPVTILLDQVREQDANLVQGYMTSVVDRSDNVVKVLMAVERSTPEHAVFREMFGRRRIEHANGTAFFLRNARPPPSPTEMETWCDTPKPGTCLSSASPSEQSDALFLALEAGHLPPLLSLIRHTPGILTHLPNNAPTIAVLHNHVPLLSYLLSLDRFATDPSPLASAFRLATLTNRFRCTVLLLSHHPAAPDPNSPLLDAIPSLSTPLLAAATRNQPRLIRLLLAHGADPNLAAASDRSLTPLSAAASAGAIDAMRPLLAADADADDAAAAAATAAAADAGHDAVVKLLVDRVAEGRRSGRKKRPRVDVAGGVRCRRAPELD